MLWGDEVRNLRDEQCGRISGGLSAGSDERPSQPLMYPVEGEEKGRGNLHSIKMANQNWYRS